MNIVFEADEKKLKELAAKKISEYMTAFGNVPILLLLAGGSSFEILPYVSADSFSEKVTISLSDERFSPDPAINNFSQLMATEFYAEATAHGSRFLDSRTQKNESLHDFGLRIENSLWNWIDENPNGKIFAVFGVGADGHTAGMMPYPENHELFAELFESDILYAAYDAGNKNMHSLRGTITAGFVRKYVSSRIVFAVGENKRSALERMLANAGSLPETPARLHREDKDAILFTDLDLKA